MHMYGGDLEWSKCALMTEYHVQVPALQLNNERFMVPELIFRPTDIAMEQAGLAEAIVEATNAVHPDLRPLLLSNVVCSGGTASCPGFAERLFAELRPLLPAEYEVCSSTLCVKASIIVHCAFSSAPEDTSTCR